MKNELVPMSFRGLSTAMLLLVFAGCATESHQAIEATKTASSQTTYSGPRSTLVVGKFDNRSSYLRGLFSDGVDRLGGQAKTILMGHLQTSGRFNLVDRDNMEEIAQEAKIRGKQQALKGADFAITATWWNLGARKRATFNFSAS